MGFSVESRGDFVWRRGGGRSRRTRPQSEPLEPRTLLAFAPLGPEFLINTQTAGSQTMPALAADADGDFVVAYTSATTEGDDVFVRRFSAAGVPAGPAVLANEPHAGSQRLPAVAVDVDGDFVVVWQSDQGINQAFGAKNIYARLYDAAGVPRGGEFRVNSSVDDAAIDPSVAMDADGDFVVVWNESARRSVQGQRFDADGLPVGSQFEISQAAGSTARAPAVAMDADGDFVVVREGGGGAASAAATVFIRAFGADGVPLSDERLASPTGDGTARTLASVAVDADGDCVVAWQAFVGYNDFRVFARRFARDGTPRGSDFEVGSTGFIDGPTVSADVDGDFLVAWNGSAGGIRARRYTAGGVAVGGEFPVSTNPTAPHPAPVAAVDHDGDAVVVWETYDGTGSRGVAAQRFDEQGDTSGPMVADVLVRGRHVAPSGVVPPDSRIVVRFSEPLSTAGGATAANSALNPVDWELASDGADVPAIQSVTYVAAAGRVEVTLTLAAPMTPAHYGLFVRDRIRDLAANPLDGNYDGAPGGTFVLPFTVVNKPPTTIGIPSVTVAEDEQPTLVNLFDAFSDPDDPVSSLLLEVTGNTNPALFRSVNVDPASGTLRLDYVPNASGQSVLTVRSTDSAGQSVSTPLTVNVVPVNDAPVNAVPGAQVVAPGAVPEFRADFGNGISVSDVDAATLALTLETDPSIAFGLSPALSKLVTSSAPGVVVVFGAVGDINKGLDGLRLIPPEKFAGATSLVVTTNDNGATGAGGPQQDIDVIPVFFVADPVVLSIGDVQRAEGSSGVTTLTFPVRLQGKFNAPITVSYATVDGSATLADGDYVRAVGVLTFQPGETEKKLEVQVNGDLDVEPDETFSVVLTGPERGVIVSDGVGIGTILNDDLPAPTPVVTQVFVRGSGWTAAYKSFLQAQGLGDATFGYAVPAGAAQLNTLPWGNLNQISIRFNTDVLVLDQDLAVRGVRSAGYAVSALDYDDATHTATWTLAQPITNDKVMLDLNGGPDGIINFTGAALDGDWANGSQAYPSGDAAPGGSLRFRLNVLGGDVTRDGKVTLFDWLELRRRLARSLASPGPAGGALSYGPFYDPSGDGAVGTPDLLMVRRNYLRGLPTTDPASLAAPTSSLSSITRDVLGTTGPPVVGMGS